MQGKLILTDGSEYTGEMFGSAVPQSGEVVFSTGMVGYPESLTDPSYTGQILVLTYPLIGNYGVPDRRFWESDKVHISGLVVCNYIDTPSHSSSRQTLSQWLKQQGVPGIEIKDTRGLTQKLRQYGVSLGKIVPGPRLEKTHNDFYDPNAENLVAKVSTKKIYTVGQGKSSIALIDCGAKYNIVRSLEKRDLKVTVVPWDFDVLKLRQKFQAVVISNGPGDPEKNQPTIANIQKLLAKKMPMLGICLGNQLLGLSAGGSTYKLKFGHRGQNQPCVLSGTSKCILTTQNHGFALGKIPKGFKEWFYNANDQTNEGIIHKTLPIMSVQFHPEASPGPTDADFIFDEFLRKARL